MSEFDTLVSELRAAYRPPPVAAAKPLLILGAFQPPPNYSRGAAGRRFQKAVDALGFRKAADAEADPKLHRVDAKDQIAGEPDLLEARRHKVRLARQALRETVAAGEMTSEQAGRVEHACAREEAEIAAIEGKSRGETMSKAIAASGKTPRQILADAIAAGADPVLAEARFLRMGFQ